MREAGCIIRRVEYMADHDNGFQVIIIIVVNIIIITIIIIVIVIVIIIIVIIIIIINIIVIIIIIIMTNIIIIILTTKITSISTSMSIIFREWVKRTMVLTLAALRIARGGRRAMKLFSA